MYAFYDYTTGKNTVVIICGEKNKVQLSNKEELFFNTVEIIYDEKGVVCPTYIGDGQQWKLVS